MTQPKGEIVEYEPSMAEDVAEMFNRFKESWPGGFGGSVPFDEERIHDWLDESSAFVDYIALDEDGVPVGFCNLEPHWRDDDAAYIGLLGVISRVKGQKFGKRLLLKAIERAVEEGVKRVDLHTWSGNLSAMPLYKKIGMFWVPDTSVYMQDYIPLLHQNELTKEWFDEHQDWYKYQKRELKQEPNSLEVDGMKIYRYRFEDEDDWLEVDIDRYGCGITAIRRRLGDEEFSIKAKVDFHDIHMGIENSYSLEIENHTGEEKEIELEIEPFEGLEFEDDFPSSVKVEEGGSMTILQRFIVSKEAETYESSHKASETIDALLKVDGKEFKLTTGGKIKPAVEVDGSRDLHHLFSDEEEEIYFDLKNNTDRALSGAITFELDGEERKREFKLDRKESGGFKLPIKLDFDDEQVKYIELRPYIQKEDGLFPMKSYKHPLVDDTDGLLAFAEKEDEVYLVNNEIKIKAELEGAKISVNEAPRDSELRFELGQQVGPPFGRTQDTTIRYEYDVKKGKDSLLLTLEAESVHRPGVLMKRNVKIKKHASELEFWSELKNVGDEPVECASETSVRKWGFRTQPHQAKARVYTPLKDELIESDPVTDMLSSTMMPTDPKDWEETWTAYEDIGDAAVSGVIWSNENIKKIKLARGILDELKSVTKELEPGESFKSTHLWIPVKKPSLNSFRHTWNRLVGKKNIGPKEKVYGKKSREHIEVKIDDNILDAGEGVERQITVEKAVDYPMPGAYTIEFPEGLDGHFENGQKRIEVSEEEKQRVLELNINIDIDERVENAIREIKLHFSGIRELDFEIPVIITGDSQVKVEEKVKDGEKVLHVDNGKIQFDVMDGFAGNLIRLEDSDGNTYLDDSFPEPKPKSWFENHIGGLGPRLMTPDDLHSFYEIEDVSSQEYIDGRWRGVKVDFKIEKLDSLRGQKFSIKYLTLPGTKLIKIVMDHHNPKEREVNWYGEFFIDVLINGSLEDTVVKCPGKYEDWERSHQTQQFTPQPNIEKPWFLFRREDVSLAGFGVEGSPSFSTVICNEEVNMAFLVANMVSQAYDEEEIEFGMILDGDDEKVRLARRALKSK